MHCGLISQTCKFCLDEKFLSKYSKILFSIDFLLIFLPRYSSVFCRFWLVDQLPTHLFFQEISERLEEYSGNPVSQSEVSSPATYIPSPPPSSNSPESPVWSAPRRYPRSPVPTPLAHPLPYKPPAHALRPIHPPAQSPGSSPHVFTPGRKFRPPVGIPTSHLPVDPAESPGTSDQTQPSTPQWPDPQGGLTTFLLRKSTVDCSILLHTGYTVHQGLHM